MTNAPSVNQIRFLSSSALAKADQLILAASCSAADAMVLSERRPDPSAPVQNGVPAASSGAAGLPLSYGRRRRQRQPGRRRGLRSGWRRLLLAQGLQASSGLLDRRGGALRGRRDFESRFRFQFA